MSPEEEARGAENEETAYCGADCDAGGGSSGQTIIIFRLIDVAERAKIQSITTMTGAERDGDRTLT